MFQVYVHIPHSLERVSGRTAIVYAHGGGVISGTAKAYQPATACLAVETGEYLLVSYMKMNCICRMCGV